MHGESNSRYRHGHIINGKKTSTYRSWQDMKTRCQNPNHPQFKNWGGRGIKICDRWMDFVNFLADMGEKPEGLTLDRINNDGNYEPSNCRWATPKEQAQNRRDYKNQKLFIAIDKQGTMTVSNNQNEFARQHDLDQGHINRCLMGRLKTHKGWRFKKIPIISGEPLFIPMKVECYA